MSSKRDIFGNVNLRSASPVRKLAGGARKDVQSLQKRCNILATWACPEGGESNPFVLEAYGALEKALKGFSKFFSAMQVLDGLGFSPPRVSLTAATTAGDTVTVLDQFRERYVDIMNPFLMVDLYVERVYPGRGGGLVVLAKNGVKMKVAKSHVAKVS